MNTEEVVKTFEDVAKHIASLCDHIAELNEKVFDLERRVAEINLQQGAEFRGPGGAAHHLRRYGK